MENPSPRMIASHITKLCEWEQFRIFLTLFSVNSKISLTEVELGQIKNEYPNWYIWLQEKGLVAREKVKKQAWTYLYGTPETIMWVCSSIYPNEETARSFGQRNYPSIFIKTVLVHEWEE